MLADATRESLDCMHLPLSDKKRPARDPIDEPGWVGAAQDGVAKREQGRRGGEGRGREAAKRL